MFEAGSHRCFRISEEATDLKTLKSFRTAALDANNEFFVNKWLPNDPSIKIIEKYAVRGWHLLNHAYIKKHLYFMVKNNYKPYRPYNSTNYQYRIVKIPASLNCSWAIFLNAKKLQDKNLEQEKVKKYLMLLQ